MRRLILPVVAVAVALIAAAPREGASALQPINFIRGTVQGTGFGGIASPTAIEVGPDGRVYVANSNGELYALTLNANKAVIATEQIAVADVLQPTGLQEVFGIAFDPADSSSPPPIYVTNTISGFGGDGQAPPGSFPGRITKISGAGYDTFQDIITGLPVSNSGHESNGLAFGPDGRLYIAQGSTTNAGIAQTGPNLFTREEVPTSGAILVADIKAPGFNGNITYNPPNVYDSSIVKTGGDVSVYASGLRNPYDLAFHSNGRLYNTDNGPNSGYGVASVTCTTQGNAPGPNAPDELNIIVAGAYYGHPNRNRGLAGATRECTYHPGTEASNAEYTAPIGLLPTSSDGIAEYKSGVFGGQMQGDLLYVSWVDGTLHRVELSPDGSAVAADLTLASALPGALDVAIDSDGTIFVAEYNANRITFFRPDESPVSGITVTGIAPSAGPLSGGQSVTITGTNFTSTSDTAVLMGSGGTAQPFTNVVVQNSTTITAVTPPQPIGAKDVRVTNSVGTATLVNGYNYVSGGGTTPPVANAGDDWSGPVAHEIHAHAILDARNSFDPDGFITSWEWREGSTVLSRQEVDAIEFTEGEHLITLTVTDNDNYTDTDTVRIIVTATAENPQPYYCFDVDGDTDVDISDLQLVANAYGTRFGQAGYTRMRDYNADRVINSGDIQGTLDDFTSACPLLDQQIRTATAGMEQYQNVNAAIAAGYGQVTPYVPGQGRHMVKGGVQGTMQQDLVFEPAFPESLLYEPDSSTPGGWRLAGAMYIIPYNLTTVPPDGFAGTEDAWHYHPGLCIWNNGNAVAEDWTLAQCNSVSGVWFEKAGWLAHIWNYHPNPTGRFVEINDDLTLPPTASNDQIAIDAQPASPGVQNTGTGLGTVTVDVVATNVQNLGSFNFDLAYNPSVFSAPTVGTGPSTDRNPNANQAFLDSSGRTFTCTPPDPGAVTAGSQLAARISCTSSGLTAGPDTVGATTLASVTLNVIGNAPSGSALTLQNVNLFMPDGTEISSCNPTSGAAGTCVGATITTQAAADGDGDGCSDAKEGGLNHLLGGDRDSGVSWDFYDVPVPAMIGTTGGFRNGAIAINDTLAIVAYIGTMSSRPTQMNNSGARYGSDINANGVQDGAEYDRTPSTTPGKPWRAGAPDGAVTISDALINLYSLGDNCTGP